MSISTVDFSLSIFSSVRVTTVQRTSRRASTAAQAATLVCEEAAPSALFMMQAAAATTGTGTGGSPGTPRLCERLQADLNMLASRAEREMPALAAPLRSCETLASELAARWRRTTTLAQVAIAQLETAAERRADALKEAARRLADKDAALASVEAERDAARDHASRCEWHLGALMHMLQARPVQGAASGNAASAIGADAVASALATLLGAVSPAPGGGGGVGAHRTAVRRRASLSPAARGAVHATAASLNTSPPPRGSATSLAAQLGELRSAVAEGLDSDRVRRFFDSLGGVYSATGSGRSPAQPPAPQLPFEPAPGSPAAFSTSTLEIDLHPSLYKAATVGQLKAAVAAKTGRRTVAISHAGTAFARDDARLVDLGVPMCAKIDVVFAAATSPARLPALVPLVPAPLAPTGPHIPTVSDPLPPPPSHAERPRGKAAAPTPMPHETGPTSLTAMLPPPPLVDSPVPVITSEPAPAPVPTPVPAIALASAPTAATQLPTPAPRPEPPPAPALAPSRARPVVAATIAEAAAPVEAAHSAMSLPQPPQHIAMNKISASTPSQASLTMPSALSAPLESLPEVVVNADDNASHAEKQETQGISRSNVAHSAPELEPSPLPAAAPPVTPSPAPRSLPPSVRSGSVRGLLTASPHAVFLPSSLRSDTSLPSHGQADSIDGGGVGSGDHGDALRLLQLALGWEGVSMATSVLYHALTHSSQAPRRASLLRGTFAFIAGDGKSNVAKGALAIDLPTLRSFIERTLARFRELRSAVVAAGGMRSLPVLSDAELSPGGVPLAFLIAFAATLSERGDLAAQFLASDANGDGTVDMDEFVALGESIFVTRPEREQESVAGISEPVPVPPLLPPPPPPSRAAAALPPSPLARQPSQLVRQPMSMKNLLQRDVEAPALTTSAAVEAENAAATAAAAMRALAEQRAQLPAPSPPDRARADLARQGTMESLRRAATARGGLRSPTSSDLLASSSPPPPRAPMMPGLATAPPPPPPISRPAPPRPPQPRAVPPAPATASSSIPVRSPRPMPPRPSPPPPPPASAAAAAAAPLSAPPPPPPPPPQPANLRPSSGSPRAPPPPPPQRRAAEALDVDTSTAEK